MLKSGLLSVFTSHSLVPFLGFGNKYTPFFRSEKLNILNNTTIVLSFYTEPAYVGNVPAIK